MWRQNAQRICSIAMWVLVAMGLSLPEARAVPLTSQFLSSDASAAAVMAGTPYDMADPNWLAAGKYNRNIFAYKIYSALLMLGYQTEPYQSGPVQVGVLKLFQANNPCGNPASSLLEATCLSLIDQQLASREPLLASLAAGFPLYGHMQPLVANDISRDTLAATYWLPMTVLPASLQMNFYETLQCLAGQCNGFIHDASGNTISGWPTPIDPASNAYYFVGAYYDRFVDNSQMPSAAVSADTVLHEFGHYIDGYIPWSKDPLLPHLGVIDTTSFNSITFDLSDPGNHRPNCVKRKTENPFDWLSKYGFNNYSGAYCDAGYSTTVENWAEAFAMYVTAGRDFRAAANQSNYIAQEYDWLKTHVFSGLEYGNEFDTEFDTDLPQGSNSGCNDVYGLQSALPGYMHCNGSYVWDFTLPHGTVNGVCGSAKNGTFVNAPSSNLCVSGAASVVGNTGNWIWTCRGLNNGSTDSCSATVLTGNAPDSPTAVTAIAGNTIANVSFSSPGNFGSDPIDGYTVTSSPSGGVDSNAGSTALTHTLTGLTNDTPYTFTATAHNTFGNSAPSVASAVVTPTWSLVSENFDALTPPALPAGWQSIVQIQASGLWRSNAGVNCPPDVSAHSGSNLVYFNAHTAGVNQSARLIPPAFSLAGVSGARISFWMCRDGDETKFMTGDYVEVYVNTTNSLGPTKLDRIYRSKWMFDTGMAPAQAKPGWYKYTYDVPNTFIGLTNYLILYGYGAGGNDIYLDDIVVAVPPGAPTVTGVSAGNGQATVTFSAPLNNGGSAVAGYTVSSIPAGGTDTNAGSTSLTHTVTGLTNGTSYSFTVTASNAVANSAPSSQSGSVTPVTVPSAPQSPVASARSKGATVSFFAPADNGGSSITGYTVTSSPVGGVDMHADTLNLSHSVVGLTNGVNYTFAVTANNGVGLSDPASTSTVTPVLDSTSVAVSASPNPSVVGESVTFTATVSGAALTGTVEFFEGGNSLWPAMNLTSNQAHFTDTPSVGSHSITASYSGDSTNAPNISPVFSMQVNKADVVITLTSHSPNPSFVLRPVTVKASVAAKAPGVGYPAGTITVSDGTVSCQFEVGNPSGCELTPTSTGTKNLVASYGGDSNFNTGDSVAVQHTVTASVVPGKPTIAAAVPRTNSAVVAFAPPLSDGGSDISGYTASCAPAGGTAHSSQGTTSPLLVSGLVNGVAHACYVTATNAAGTSAASDPVLVTPGLPVPQLSIASHAPNPSAFGASFPVQVSIGPAVPAVAIAGGGDHTCLLDNGGNLRCWGRNGLGQLGDGTRVDRPVPVVVPGLPAGVTAVAGGLAHTCAIVSTNVWCWGDNSGGQIGADPTTVPYSLAARQVSGLTGVVAVAAGSNFSCALNAAGNVYCWGDNVSGALGNGQVSTGYSTPIPTPALVNFGGVSVTSGITAIGAGWGHACAIDNAGKVYCWGANNIGQLGNNTSAPFVPAPVAVVMPTEFADAVSVGGGLEHSCALTATGTVWCWGGNGYDELGDGGTLGSSPVPINTTGFAHNVVGLSVGMLDNCAVDSLGIVYCWGTGVFEVAGLGNANPSRPVAVSTAANDFSAVAIGNMHTCAQARNGSVTCWGNNDFSQLGDTTLVSRTALGHVSGYANPTGVIDVGDAHSVCHISSPATSCNLTPSTPGIKALSASYSGDTSYNSASSFIVAHTVSPAIAGVTLGSSVNPSFFGQMVNWTATVTGSFPAGAVTFSDGATTLCSAVPLTGGQAQCSTSSLSAGSHNLLATYSGDSNNTGATSNVLVQAVASPGSASSTTTLVASPVSSSVSGKTVTLTAQVSGAGVPPTGFVDFKDGATALATLPLSGQSAVFITNALTAGPHSLSANYSGNATYQPSLGQLGYTVLAPINTTVTVSTSPNPSQPGQAVTVTANVSGSPSGGTVAVSGGGQNCTITLPATACTLAFPTKGAKKLAATYSGYGVYVSSSGSKTHYVGKKSDITPILMLLLD